MSPLVPYFNKVTCSGTAGTLPSLPYLVIVPHIPVPVGERGGSVVECRTPEREVGGSKPTAAVLCP